MKGLIRAHRYLSCFVAPAMLFFAVSGAWQAFRLQEDAKDGSYVAPDLLKQLSLVHKAERLHGAAAAWFRTGQMALAMAFVATAILGIIMAFRVVRPTWLVWSWLAAGVLIPALLTLATRTG